MAVGAALASAMIAGPALARINGNNGNGGNKTSTSSLRLVLLNSTDGVPHWGQKVTFKVSTTATSQPFVSLRCYKSTTLVYSAQAGYYTSYPWPSAENMVLKSNAWRSGGADCTATLFYASGNRVITLATRGFHVYA
ncbi:MAG: hypothetical protein M3P11_04580 [Actinomycetota bacterium]|nr:hypothetical protein [Actinomycetota bacterium]